MPNTITFAGIVMLNQRISGKYMSRLPLSHRIIYLFLQ